MFCKYCGNQLDDNSMFCTRCGSNQDTDYELETLKTNISRSYNVMSAIKQKENQVYAANVKLRKYRIIPAIKRLLKIFGLCILVDIIAGILPSLGGILFLGIRIDDIFTQVTYLLPFSFIIVPILFKMKSNNIKRKLQGLENELANLKSDNSLSWLPYSYRDSKSYNCIASYIINQRATSLKDAINLYETEKHQSRVEMLSKEAVDAATSAADYARSAAKDARSAASSASSAASSASSALYR
ncbi:MAG: zinc-ribbon domain-containing protein [Lachnospiraceae bacterium]|nr:zinc-ribbon domain-containing protein [Lachnospiraceae bacterium]